MQLNTITNISSMVTNFSYNGHTVSELAVLVVTTVSGVFTILNHHAGNRGHRTYCLIITIGSSYVYFKLCSDNILGGHIKELENNVERFATENDTYAAHNIQNQAQISKFQQENEDFRKALINLGKFNTQLENGLENGVEKLNGSAARFEAAATRNEAATGKLEAATAKHEAATAKLEAAIDRNETTTAKNEASAAQFEQMLQTPNGLRQMEVSSMDLGSRFLNLGIKPPNTLQKTTTKGA